MAKMTKAQLEAHRECEALLKKPRDLKPHEIWYVLQNWQPLASNRARGTYFTPPYVASIVEMNAPDEGIGIDLGGGIGHLVWYMWDRITYRKSRQAEYYALENDEEQCEVGQRLFPQVNWVLGDMFDLDTWAKLPKIDWFVSNPPFGHHKKVDWLESNGECALMAVEVGLRMTEWQAGIAILPQVLCPFECSGKRNYAEKNPSIHGQRFIDRFPQVSWTVSGFDTIQDQSHSGFSETSITVEVCGFEFNWITHGDRPYPLDNIPEVALGGKR